jgi:hypothetical protein
MPDWPLLDRERKGMAMGMLIPFTAQGLMVNTKDRLVQLSRLLPPAQAGSFAGLLLSRTQTVNRKLPAVVGVPLIRMWSEAVQTALVSAKTEMFVSNPMLPVSVWLRKFKPEGADPVAVSTPQRKLPPAEKGTPPSTKIAAE